MHCEEKYKLLWTETKNFRKQHGGEAAKLTHKVRRPSRYDISEQHVWQTLDEYYLSIYYQVLDHACDRLRQWFSTREISPHWGDGNTEEGIEGDTYPERTIYTWGVHK
ncbi:hypothetical protein LOD99_7138 [Oopsacas minuta]|uniref:Uncharacterized protein n=1 Tax=Oopsacas minuta TaxID=111878 RepID=A0AAV7JIP4_9METZ|nr:hypothetical protein LOD99_7138 [Oopsacas minuta]